jgi:hypothetical protein
MSKPDDYRELALQATKNHHIAAAEHKMASEHKKSKASEKLAERLRKKSGKSVNTDEFATNADLQEVKAAKLEQHRLQEARRKLSMNVAKERSAIALQKRLEDIARKKMQDTGNGKRMTEIFESADEVLSDED